MRPTKDQVLWAPAEECVFPLPRATSKAEENRPTVTTAPSGDLIDLQTEARDLFPKRPCGKTSSRLQSVISNGNMVLPGSSPVSRKRQATSHSLRVLSR